MSRISFPGYSVASSPCSRGAPLSLPQFSRRLLRLSRPVCIVRAAEGDADGGVSPEEEGAVSETFSLAPSQPKTSVGQMAAYYLQMQPHLFQDTVDSELSKIKEAIDAESEAAQSSESAASSSSQEPSLDLVLSRRMAEVKRAERRVTVEDLMYICILQKFQSIGVELLPRVEPIEEDILALKSLTEGVHSLESLALVKQHILGLLGPAAMSLPDTIIKMSKLQAAQLYAASTMFGYFLRKVDARFQLTKAMGMLPEDPGDAVSRLERLFSVADDFEDSDEPDSATPPPPPQFEAPTVPDSMGGTSQQDGLKPKKNALRDYIESFDQDILVEMARIVTAEGAALIDRQTKALFGDVKDLNREMQEVVGEDARSVEELMERVEQAVANEKVSTVTMSVATQRRVVLEAVAYGCFLRDVEGRIDGDYHGLLTPISSMS